MTGRPGSGAGQPGPGASHDVAIDGPPARDLLETIELVIFDKDGTLIDFHLMWSGWVRELGDRLAAELDGRRLDAQLDEALGVDPVSGRVRPHGALAATPMARLRDLVLATVIESGIPAAVAGRALDFAWRAPDPMALAHPLADLPALFRGLKGRGMRIAIATSDDREPTERTLEHLHLVELVDAVTCADDGLPVKPDPAAVLRICQLLGSLPDRAMVVGDSPADLAMARAAGAGRVVGVLTGVGDAGALTPLADAVLGSVSELLPPA